MKRPLPVIALLAAVVANALVAQQPTPDTPRRRRPRADNLRFIRMKISAGDLPSAESILEVSPRH